jgi:hypothetical protein
MGMRHLPTPPSHRALAQTILSNANIDREAAKKCVDEHDVKIIDKAKAWPDSK